MDIQKIKNYNQKMLAIITTVAVAFAVIGLFSFIFFLFIEISGHTGSSHSYSTKDLPTKNLEIEKHELDNQKHLISYSFPYLIDTVNQIFIISARHETFNE